jgi:hypothetical protein
MMLSRLIAVFFSALSCGAPIAQAAKAERVAIEYVPPVNPLHKPLYDMLKEQEALERVP